MSFFTPDIAFHEATPMPSPIVAADTGEHSEGELIPSRLLAPSTMPERNTLNLSAIQEPRDLMPSPKSVTMFFTDFQILRPPLFQACQIAAIISGNLATKLWDGFL